MNEISTATGSKKPLIILVLVVFIGVVAILFASNVDPDDIQSKADINNLPIELENTPDLDTSLGWLNTKGYNSSQLEGKVVVYDFWTYSCVNCQRTLPYLRALWDRYEEDGLVIVGIHSPEFNFEKDHDNIEDATKKYDVTWPVLFDDNKTNWDHFDNRYWPAKYIADKQGRIRYHHFGEGRYDETEDVIRKLLGVKSSAPRANFPDVKQNDSTARYTRELYINPLRGVLNAKLGKSTVTEDATPEPDSVWLFGELDVQHERSVLVKPGSKLTLNYQAGEVNIVAEPLDSSGKGVLLVALEGKPVPKNMRGSDIVTDKDGNTILNVTSSDLLNVIDSDSVEKHIVTFTAQSPEIALYAFTFGA